MNKENS